MVNAVVYQDHSYVFKKVDDSIFKVIKSRYEQEGKYVDAREVTGYMNNDKVALIDEKGSMYFSTHPSYGWA